MPEAFKDKTGAEWDCAITTGAIKRVIKLCQIDLTKLFEDEEATAVRQLLADPLVIADVIYAVVKPQADARDITDEQFGELLPGMLMAEANSALMDALQVFFSALNSDMGDIWRDTLDKYRRGKSVVWSRTLQSLRDQTFNPEDEANKAFERELAKRRGLLTSGKKSGGSRAS